MAYSNKMIKEDHLLACTTRMLEIQARADHPQDRSPAVERPLGFHPNYRVHPAFGHTPSRLPTIHLSKNLINTAANQLRFRRRASLAPRRLVAVAFAQGRRILASPPMLSTGVAKNFFSPSRRRLTLAKPLAGRLLSSQPLPKLEGDKVTGPAQSYDPNRRQVRKAFGFSKCCNRNKRLQPFIRRSSEHRDTADVVW